MEQDRCSCEVGDEEHPLPPLQLVQLVSLWERKLGGRGISSAVEDSDFYLFDSVFKLLTSKDQDVATEALGQLAKTVYHRIRRPPTDGDLGSYLSVAIEGELVETTNQLVGIKDLLSKKDSKLKRYSRMINTKRCCQMFN
ncbi:hypothetical protein TNCV_2604781 [Trichonephila clavipes]|nr:hypothetical protein TNCV_2604781 [Trichonephila clavipes]